MSKSAPSSVSTPAALGFAMPAEWDRHEATWIGWPHNRSDWPGKFPPIPWVFAEMVRHLTAGETVRILVNDRPHENRARAVLLKAGVTMSKVVFHRWPTDRGWTRDFGPVAVKHARSGEVAFVDFHFNAWAKYRNWRKDTLIARKAAASLGKRLFDARRPDDGGAFVVEGGAIDVNGRGTLLTTEECLLDERTQVRNAGLGRAGSEAALKIALGVTNVLWLGKGIAGDDTHGHVDDLCRFVDEKTVVLAQADESDTANHAALHDNRERLKDMRLESGGKIEVVELPMPRPLLFNGQRLPASYANFLIANAVVIVPTFNDPADRVALDILADLFPGRTVVGIHAVDLVLGQGTLHCLTQQQPAGR